MTLLSIDPQKCHHDGICAAVCPAGIIAAPTQQQLPFMVEGGEALCIRCGHCVAVCPHMALNHSAMPAAECPPLQRQWLPDAEKAEHFLRARRSIRAYKEKPVEREQLARLIDVARHAPSGHNLQPVAWRVVYDTDQVRHLAAQVIDWMRDLIAQDSPWVETMHLDRVVRSWEDGTERIFRGAPHVIVAHAQQENRTAQSGCTIALTYLELMAPALGLGTCWAGYFTAAAQTWPPLIKALALPPEHGVFGAVMVGYPRFRYHRLPLRNPPALTWQ